MGPAYTALLGDEVLNFYGFTDYAHVWEWSLVLAGMIVGYRILAFIVLLLQKEKR